MSTFPIIDPPPDQLREKLHQEIVNIPDSRPRGIYDVIHFFQLGLAQTNQQNQPTATPDIIRFAGAWEDEDMHDFNAFENEIAQRQRTAFKSRLSLIISHYPPIHFYEITHRGTEDAPPLSKKWLMEPAPIGDNNEHQTIIRPRHQHLHLSVVG